jgi:predicted nucleotidyltransferase
MTTLAELRARRAELIALGEQYGVSNIRVFGSVARGEETPESDVDLLVTLEKGRSLTDFCEFRLSALGMLGRDVDLLDADAVHPLLRERIVLEAKPL